MDNNVRADLCIEQEGLEPLEVNQEYFTRDPGKMKVECICPKCQHKHSMVIHWIGRGTPRKFCNRCRDWAESAVTGA